MKIKIDENLPDQLTSIFEEFGHSADTAADEGLAGSADEIIWRISKQEGRVVFTQDLDFIEMHRFEAEAHSGILLLRLYNQSRASIVKRIHEVLRFNKIENWVGCLVVVSENKIRIRKGKSQGTP